MSKIGVSGKPIGSQGREIINNVIRFMQQEAEIRVKISITQYRMIESIDLKDFTKEEVQAILKRELERREMQEEESHEGNLKITNADSGIIANTKEDPEIAEALNTGDMQEAKPLLQSLETLNPLPEKILPLGLNRLEYATDSLQDVRLEKLKKMEQEKEKVLILPKKETIRYNGDEIRRNRYDLYFCYVLYFSLVFLSFALAIYVWIPILKGMMYERPNKNTNLYRYGYRHGQHTY